MPVATAKPATEPAPAQAKTPETFTPDSRGSVPVGRTDN
jgi:hypothetical protein